MYIKHSVCHITEGHIIERVTFYFVIAVTTFVEVSVVF